jgi:HK97 family phage prohead protease
MMARPQPKNTRTQGGREVIAYASRYGHLTQAETEDGEPCWVRFQPGCFDRWLDSGPSGIRVMVNHAKRLDDDGPSLVLGEPVGEFTGFAADAVGLRTVAQYDTTPLATETLAAIRNGALTAYSLRATVVDSRPNGRRDGQLVFDIVDAEVVEAGPTPDPADEDARILSVGGVELRAEPQPAMDVASALAYMTSVTGLSTECALQRIADERRQKHQQAQDRVAEAKSLARVIRHARRKIDIYGAERRQTGNAEAGQLWLAATRVERDALAELHELLCHDRLLIADVLTRAGAGGPTPTPLLPPVPLKRRR